MVTLTRTIQAIAEINSVDLSKVMQTMEEYRIAAQFASDYGYEHGTASSVKIHHQTYNDLRKSTNLPSQLICASRNKASEVLKSLKVKKVRSQPHFKFYLPIRYDRRSSTLFENQVTLATTRGRIRVKYRIPDYYEKYNDWERKGIELVYQNNIFYIYFVIKKILVDPMIHCGDVNGVDRGIKNIAADSNNNFYNGRYIREVRRKYFRLRRSLQKKGTRSSKRKLNKISRRERRFQKDINHVVSKKLVGKSQTNSTIVFENLKGIRKNMKGRNRMNREFHSWPFYQLEEFVKYKAKEKGILFKDVNPMYTSQKCSRCKYIDGNNRKGSLFRCRKCNYQTDSDRNAALNIKEDYIELCIESFVHLHSPIKLEFSMRQNLAEEGISIFSGTQVGSPNVAS